MKLTLKVHKTLDAEFNYLVKYCGTPWALFLNVFSAENYVKYSVKRGWLREDFEIIPLNEEE